MNVSASSLIRRPFRRSLVLSLLVICSIFAAAQTADAQMGRNDTKHISDTFFCVIRIDIERLASQLTPARKEELKKLSTMMRDDMGLDIANMKAMTLQYGESDVDGGMPSFAVTFEMTKKFDKQKFIDTINAFDDTVDAELNGKKYLKSKSEFGPNFYFESDQKFTAATPGAMKCVLEAGSGMGKLAAQVKSAPDAELVALFNRNGKYAESVKRIVDGISSVGLPFSVKTYFNKVESGSVYLSLQSGKPLQATLNFETAGFAEEAKSTIEKYIALAKTVMPPARESMKQELKSLDDPDRARSTALNKEYYQTGLNGLDLAAKIVGGADCTVEKNSLKIKATHMGGLKGSADVIFDGFKMFVVGVSGPSRVEGDFKGKIEKKVDRK